MMAHGKTIPKVGRVDHSDVRRTRLTPARVGNTESRVNQDGHGTLHRKLRGLRGRSGVSAGNLSDDSITFGSESQEGGGNVLGSNRSVKSHGSVISADSGASGDSIPAGSFAVYGGSTPKDALKLDSSVPSAESPTTGHGIPRSRGLSRRTGGSMMSSTGSRINPVSEYSISQAGLPDASEHSTNSLGLRNGTRGRARGLGGRRQISTTRVVEPSQAPMVSTQGSLAPLVGKAPSRRINGSGSSQLTISSASTSSRTSITSESMSMRSPIPPPGPPQLIVGSVQRSDHPSESCSVIKMDNSSRNSIGASAQSAPAMLSASRRRERYEREYDRVYLPNNTSRGERRGARPGSSHRGARGRQQGSVTSSRRLPAHIQEAQQESMNAARNATQNALPPQVQEAQEQSLSASRAPTRSAPPAQAQEAQGQSETLYQPTEEDWARLYNRHVQELERKDLEIAMKMSSLPGVGEQQDEGGAQNGPNEEEMLRLALEMSRNDENDTFQNNNADVGLGHNASGGLGNDDNCNGNTADNDILNMPYPSQQAKGPEEDSDLERALRLSAEQPQRQALSEEEELERILRLSQEQAEQAAQPAKEEDDELLRILRMSEMQHEEEQKKHKELTQSDEELQRILELSQQEATHVDKERETMELVLKLSQMGEL